MASSERDSVFEKFVRSSRERFVSDKVYEVMVGLREIQATVNPRKVTDWMQAKLSVVLLEWEKHLDDLAERYASLRVDKAPAETSSTGPKNIFRMPEIVTADWLPEGEVLLVNPGVKCLATDADGKVAEYWEKNPSAVLVKNVGVPDGHSK